MLSCVLNQGWLAAPHPQPPEAGEELGVIGGHQRQPPRRPVPPEPVALRGPPCLQAPHQAARASAAPESNMSVMHSDEAWQNPSKPRPAPRAPPPCSAPAAWFPTAPLLPPPSSADVSHGTLRRLEYGPRGGTHILPLIRGQITPSMT